MATNREWALRMIPVLIRWAQATPKTSPEDDIIRGVFQCVKYKAVMDAMRVTDNGNYENCTLLVLAGKMPDSARQMANDLNGKYKENFKISL